MSKCEHECMNNNQLLLLCFGASQNLHSKLCNTTLVATKQHATLRSYVVLIWMFVKRELVQHVTIRNYTKSTMQK